MKKTLMTLALLAAGGIAAPAMAADCAITVEGNDQMQFSVKNIEVPKSCKNYTVTLKHVGKMPKSSMGHNLVLTTAADATAAAADGMKAGAAADYVKAGDTRVIAHTKVIGGGESTQVVIDVAKLKAGTDYTYFCSFPGHSFIMKGALKLGA
ncbi:MAG: azurin [Comamonas sp.]|jgi:azurin|uniref:Azurin n=1 Tax=Comamonas avium TaxID=2762231 RepID=A0ABR8SAK7_9BURK|nr:MULTISPECIES: azurin [Comamonas]MBD7960517.1 azurin [Comamonas avium]MBD9401717.1 azurin [Comamonas sp. CMM02]MBP9941065.1 azurin [Comamonas sp.]